MPPKTKPITYDSTVRRGSLRSSVKKPEASAAESAKTADSRKTPTKKATAKATAKPRPAAAGTKRKSPSPKEPEDFECPTAVEDEETGKSPKKKAKTSGPKNGMKKAKPKKDKGKTIKKEDSTEAEEPDVEQEAATSILAPVDSEVLSSQITEAVELALATHASQTSQAPPVTEQVARGVRIALTPYLDVLDPFMQFQMLCNGRNADTVLGLEIAEKMSEVLDVVRKLKAEAGDEREEGEEDYGLGEEEDF